MRHSEKSVDGSPAVREGNVRDLARPGEHAAEVPYGHYVARADAHPLPRGVTIAGRAVPFPTQVAGWIVEGSERPSGCVRVASGGIGLPVTERILEQFDAAPVLKHVSGE